MKTRVSNFIANLKFLTILVENFCLIIRFKFWELQHHWDYEMRTHNLSFHNHWKQLMFSNNIFWYGTSVPVCVCVGYIYKLFCLLNIRNFIRWSAAVHQVLILYIYSHNTQAYVVPPWFLSKVRECEAWVSTESSKHADILFISYLCSQDKCPNDCDFLEDDPKSPNEM